MLRNLKRKGCSALPLFVVQALRCSRCCCGMVVLQTKSLAQPIHQGGLSKDLRLWPLYWCETILSWRRNAVLTHRCASASVGVLVYSALRRGSGITSV